MRERNEHWRVWGGRLIVPLVAAACAGCAAPLQRAAPVAPPPADQLATPGLAQISGRPTVGVAFGGGSARGIAHVGVIRWLEEHRIPIDVAAGTSMGGLIGGAFASGMDAARARDVHRLAQLGSAVRRVYLRVQEHPAQGRRARLSVAPGVRARGAASCRRPRSTAASRSSCCSAASPPRTSHIDDFDDLPTPFRTVAVDLSSAQPVVMRRGSLADAMRATMSLPLIFPPVEIDGQVLIDGGHHEQRAGRRREGDGRRPCRWRSTSATWPIARASATRCSAWRETRSTR